MCVALCTYSITSFELAEHKRWVCTAGLRLLRWLTTCLLFLLCIPSGCCGDAQLLLHHQDVWTGLHSIHINVTCLVAQMPAQHGMLPTHSMRHTHRNIT